MMRSLFSAVSGLKAHQQEMDVIGNNIANVNTPGFKKSRVTFQDLLSQTIRGASLPTETRGGTNPIQIGPGVGVASIDTIFDGNSLQETGKSTDLGISGDGLFIVADGDQRYYTRAGSFDFDSEGNFVSLLNGMHVQGWMAAADGTIIADPTAVGNISIDMSQSAPANATGKMVFSGNLDAGLNNATLLFANETGTQSFQVTDGTNTGSYQLSFTPAGPFNTWTWNVTDATTGESLGTGQFSMDSVTGQLTLLDTNTATISLGGVNYTLTPPASGGTNPAVFTISGGPPAASYVAGHSLATTTTTFTPPEKNVVQTVYDALGNEYNVVFTMVKEGTGNWTWNVSSITDTQGNTYSVISGGNGPLTFDGVGKLTSGGTGTLTFNPTAGVAQLNINIDFSQMTQYASDTTFGVQTQDGYASGGLKSFSIDTTGTIVGVFSNGVNKTLAQIALARFPNPAGLAKEGDTLFSETSNSGIATVQTAGSSGFGTVKPGSLEMSNVDLAQEFSNMIITQRGFQANSRVITASDEMLQELVNLKR